MFQASKILFTSLIISLSLLRVVEAGEEYERSRAREPLTLLYALDQTYFTSDPNNIIYNEVVTCPIDKDVSIDCPWVEECSARQCPNRVYLGTRERLDEECYKECQKCIKDCNQQGCSKFCDNGTPDCKYECTIVEHVWCKYYSSVSVSVVRQLKEKYGQDWGDAENPNCGGITIDMIRENLSAQNREDTKLDLSEFYPYVESHMP